jgi:uncharacterized protein YbjT (DUF2867 family)
MKKALVLGATGLVGGHLLQQLEKSGMYSEIIVPTRRPLGRTGTALRRILMELNTAESLAGQLQADDIFCCLGSTLRQAGSEAGLYLVDYDGPMRMARLQKNRESKRFFLVSAVDASLDSPFPYAVIKAELERDIQKLGFESTLIFRPSMILGARRKFRLLETLAKLLFEALRPLVPARYKAIEAEDIARGMRRVAQWPHVQGHVVIDNAQIFEIARGQ